MTTPSTISVADIAAMRQQGDLEGFLQALTGRTPPQRPAAPQATPEAPRGRPGAWPADCQRPGLPPPIRGPGGIVGVLEDWRTALHSDRGWTVPVVPAGIEPRVRTAVKALTVNLPWIAAEWPVAGEFATEIRNLYRDVTSITAPAEHPGVRVGYCPAVYDGVLCGAALRLPRGTDTITCAWCRAEYPQRLWMWLRGVQDELTGAS